MILHRAAQRAGRFAREDGKAPSRARFSAGVALAGALALAALGCTAGEQRPMSTGAPTEASTVVATRHATVLPAPGLSMITRDYLEACRSPGAVIGVRAADGATEITVAGEFAPDVPLQEDSQFLAGSVTKLFVATLAYQLIGAKRLSLDDRVAQFLPDWADGERITVGMLLSHRSGMADYGNDLSDELRDLVLADLTRVFTYDEVLALVARRPPIAEPGTTFHYSNANAIVLGAIIQRLLGTTLGDAMRTRIFEPLGLVNTIYGPDELDVLRAVVFHGLYDIAGTGDPINIGGFPREAAFTVDPAGAGIVSNTSDMLTFIDALYGTDQLLPQTLRIELANTVNTVTAQDLGVDGRVDIRGHGGVSPGAQVIAAHDLVTGTSVVAWCNRLDRPANVTPTVLAVQRVFAALAAQDTSGGAAPHAGGPSLPATTQVVLLAP